MRVYPNDDNSYSLAFLMRRLGLEPTLEEFLFSLTPRQRDAICELRNRARREAKFSAFPLLRVHDVERWVAARW